MVTPDEEYDQYAKDPRTACKYGKDCYQRNPLHHQKYKHPPKLRNTRKDTDESDQHVTKKPKIDCKPQGQSSTSAAEDAPKPKDAGDNVESKVKDVPSASSVSQLKENDNKPMQRIPPHFDKKEFIKEKFLFDMPEDFYQFWDFCATLNSSDPSKAYENVGLTLVGPYDVLANKFYNAPEKPPEEYLIHWRYFHDPPEFQTVIKGSNSTGYHIGYFRDNPNVLPVFVASNHAKKNGEISCMGDNLFAAVCLFLEEAKMSCDPFKKITISKLYAAVKAQAEKLNLNLSSKTASIKERDKKILTRTFNKAGLVVPYKRKTQLGYRHLCVSDKELLKLLDRVAKASDQQRSKVMSELQPVLTATSIATDECDFGTGIELGLNILAHDVDLLNNTIAQYLTTSFQLLQWDAFAKIVQAHMKNRRKGTDLSIL